MAQQITESPKEFVECPACGTLSPRNNIQCQCGKALHGTEECVACLGQIPKGIPYCQYCGARQTCG